MKVSHSLGQPTNPESPEELPQFNAGLAPDNNNIKEKRTKFNLSAYFFKKLLPFGNNFIKKYNLSVIFYRSVKL